MQRASFLAVTLALLPSCGGPSITLVVDLRTDLVAGEEFVAVRTELFRDHPSTGAPPRTVVDRSAFRTDDFVLGTRVAELPIPEPGTYRLRLALIDADGDTAISQLATVEVTASETVTILITRSCRGVSCAPGQVCAAGSCVDESCREGCATDCVDAADCVTTAICIDAQCVDGACFLATLEGACAAGEWCNPEVGCQPRTVELDAGPPDAGRMDSGVADSGTPDTSCAPDCSGRQCGPDPHCGVSCGDCPAGYACNGSGGCDCVPDCAGRACGTDPRCGASCGGCSTGQTCDAAGQCVCAVDCGGLACGPDRNGCGTDCGSCSLPATCSGGACLCGGIGAGCTTGTDTCCGGAVCGVMGGTANTCCLPVNEACGNVNECCQPGNRACRPSTANPGTNVCCLPLREQSCSTNEQCCRSDGGDARNCRPDMVRGGSFCCMPTGSAEACFQDAQCCSNNCVSNRCT